MVATHLVTGAAGFIGSHLVDRLLARGDAVVALDNFDDFYDPAIKRRNVAAHLQHGRYALVEGDVRDRTALASAFGTRQVDSVVHLAARAGVRPSLDQPVLYSQVNVEGTAVLLEEARRHGAGRFVFGSSSSVYGAANRLPFREDDRIDRPYSPYAATKVAGEALCHAFHHLYGVPTICLRFFTAYGPRQRPDLAIHKFARLMAAGQPIPVYGDGTSRRDYTYIDDIVAGVVAAIDHAGTSFEVVNLGESRTVELRELIALLEQGLGRRAAIERLPDQPGDMPATWADVTRAGELLGYEPRTPIEEGLRRFVDWFRGQPAG